MNKVICWWSGGVTSAVACKLAIDLYGKENCRVIFIDTRNEDEDTYRFKTDCEKWYELPIEIITAIGGKWHSIQDVWIARKSLNTATGAVCSSELKRRVREVWEKENEWKHQVFGFDLNEAKRAKSMALNNSHTKPIFPLMMYGLYKKDCVKIIEAVSITIPRVYSYGYLNNNCFKTGCVQGGIGYWQKIKREYPDKFKDMAEMEHIITDLKGKPVTMLKDQSNEAKSGNNWQVFLIKHPDYPYLKCIDDMRECKVEPLFECNGYCGINDLDKRNPTELELNFGEQS